MTTQPKRSNKTKPPAPRKRGGQPGNTNAIKHGFYTKNFSLAERKDLQAVKPIVLEDEIALLRVLIRRFADQILASQGVAINESAQHLAVVSEAMLWNKVEPPKQSEGGCLGSLLRTNHMLGGSESNTFLSQLTLALKEVSEEMDREGG